jgi:hypothetical protein
MQDTGNAVAGHRSNEDRADFDSVCSLGECASDQARSSWTRCLDQSLSSRLKPSRDFTVSLAGWRPCRMVFVISGLKKLGRNTRVKYDGLTPASRLNARIDLHLLLMNMSLNWRACTRSAAQQLLAIGLFGSFVFQRIGIRLLEVKL